MAEEKGNTAGIIRLDLIINAKVEDQVKQIADKAKKSAEKQFESVGESIEKAITEPIKNLDKQVKAPLEKVQKEAEKSAAAVQKAMAAGADKASGKKAPRPEDDALPKTETPDANQARGPPVSKPSKLATQILREQEEAAAKVTQKVKETAKAAEAMANPWQVAGDKVGLLQQKLDLIYGEMGRQEDKLKRLNQQYAELGNGELGGEAAQKLEAQIDAAQSKLISLQSSAMQTEQAISKATAAPAAAAAQTWKAASAPADMLRQKLQVINTQIALQAQRLAEVQAEYRAIAAEEGADSGAARKKLADITAIQSKLISLQQTGRKTGEELNKVWTQQRVAAMEGPLERIKSKVAGVGQAARESISNGFKAGAKQSADQMNWMEKKAQNTGKNIKSAFKRVFVMATLYAGFRALKDYMGQAAMQNKEFATSLNQVRGNLATAFAPIFSAIMPALNALMSGLATVTKYIAAFISGLFGKTYKQSVETAKGIQSVGAAATGAGAAAKKAAKAMGELAAFDQINVIQQPEQDDGSSGGGGGGADPGIDFGALDTEGTSAAEALAEKIRNAFKTAITAAGQYFQENLLPNVRGAIDRIAPEFDRFKQIMGGVWQDIVTLGQPFMDWFQTDFTEFLQTRIDTIGIVVSGMFEMFNTTFSSIWNLVLFPFAQDFVTTVLPMITQAATQLDLTFQEVFGAIKEVFLTLWRDAVEPVMSQIMDIWTDVTAILRDLWDRYGETTFAKVRETIRTVKDVFLNTWNNVLKPVWDHIMQVVDWLWTKHLKPLVARIGEFIAVLVNGAMDIYNKFIAPVVKWFNEFLGPIISNNLKTIADIFGTVFGFIADLLGALLRQLGGIVDFIAGVFTLDWERAWKGLGDIVGGIGDGIKAVFKGAINLIIDLLNNFTGGLNWIPKTLSKVPGFGWAKNFQIPQIPKFAQGGIVDKPTLSMIGEDGAEAVVPLRNNTQWIGEVAKQLADARGQGADEDTLFRALLRALKEFFGEVFPLPDIVIQLPDGSIKRIALQAVADYQKLHGGALPWSI